MRAWPALLGVVVVLTVAAPAAVASYGHAREVAARHDPGMADWLPLSVDGMLLAAVVVMWVRRRRREPVGKGPWAAFIFGIVVTIGANAAAVNVPSFEAYAVHLFPPVALAVALELVGLVAGRAPRPVPTVPAVGLGRTVPAPDRAPEPEPVVEEAAEEAAEPEPAEPEPAVDGVPEQDDEPAAPAEPAARVGSDEEIRAWLREHGLASRRQLTKVYICGTTRYDRLLAEAREPALRRVQ